MAVDDPEFVVHRLVMRSRRPATARI